MKFVIVEQKTQQVLDADACPTMYMLADWPGRMGKAVRRKGCWYAIDYPAFTVMPDEQVFSIKIREER